MMAAAVEPGPPISFSLPEEVFRLPESFRVQGPARHYEILPDGRFLVVVRSEPEPPPPISRLQLVQNWFAELERLSPVDGDPAAVTTQ